MVVISDGTSEPAKASAPIPVIPADKATPVIRFMIDVIAPIGKLRVNDNQESTRIDDNKDHKDKQEFDEIHSRFGGEIE
jgi:hypothetical protein